MKKSIPPSIPTGCFSTRKTPRPAVATQSRESRTAIDALLQRTPGDDVPTTVEGPASKPSRESAVEPVVQQDEHKDWFRLRSPLLPPAPTVHKDSAGIQLAKNALHGVGLAIIGLILALLGVGAWVAVNTAPSPKLPHAEVAGKATRLPSVEVFGERTENGSGSYLVFDANTYGAEPPAAAYDIFQRPIPMSGSDEEAATTEPAPQAEAAPSLARPNFRSCKKFRKDYMEDGTVQLIGEKCRSSSAIVDSTEDSRVIRSDMVFTLTEASP